MTRGQKIGTSEENRGRSLLNNIQFSILMGRRKRQQPYLDRAGEGMGNEKVMIRGRARA